MPKNLLELLADLKETLPVTTLEELKDLAHDDLIDCHFGFNMYLRNTYLWHDQTPIMPLLREVAVFPHEDSASALITEILWLDLNGTSLTYESLRKLLIAHGLLYEGKPFPWQKKPLEEAIHELLGEEKEN